MDTIEEAEYDAWDKERQEAYELEEEAYWRHLDKLDREIDMDCWSGLVA